MFDKPVSQIVRFPLLIILCASCLQGAHAQNTTTSLIPVITRVLLDTDQSTSPTPVEIHPQAGQQLAFPLSSETGALPFGFYRYLPTDFTLDTRKSFPLILFLHGLGEVGNGSSDLHKVLRNGPPKMIQNGVDFPAIVLTPQVTIGDWQRQRDGIDIPADLHTLLSYFKNNFNVDPKRVYVTGLSLGGGGAWNFTRLYPDDVAAVVPICGVGTGGANLDKLTELGVWAFHSIDDGVVASRNTERNMNRVAGTSLDGSDSVMAEYPGGSSDQIVSRVGNDWVWQTGRYNGQGKLRYTVFPDASHNAWVRAYNQDSGLNSPMWEWLFSQSKPPAE